MVHLVVLHVQMENMLILLIMFVVHALKHVLVVLDLRTIIVKLVKVN